MRTLTTSTLLITSTLLLAACSTTPTTEAPVTNTSATNATGTSAATTAVPAPKAATTANSADSNMVPAQNSVFFDYDSFALKGEFTPVVEAHAKYLVKNPNSKAVVQGNADERGGSEYNLALGQKRAEAERKALQLLGVPASQLEAVSFGKEKPRSKGHDEKSWADNRRADIVYPSK